MLPYLYSNNHDFTIVICLSWVNTTTTTIFQKEQKLKFRGLYTMARQGKKDGISIAVVISDLYSITITKWHHNNYLSKKYERKYKP